MAKRANSNTKSAAFNVAAAAQPIVDAILGRATAVEGFKAAQSALGAASRSVSSCIMESISTMTAEEHALGLFGNGLKGKQHLKGAVGDKLSEDGYKSVRHTLSMARTVALGYIAGTARLKGDDGAYMSLRAAYDAINAKAETPAETKAETEPSHKPGPEETVEQMIARIGLSKVLHAAAAILASQRKTKTEAAAIEAICTKIAA